MIPHGKPDKERKKETESSKYIDKFKLTLTV